MEAAELMPLHTPTALITGASRGLGAEIARAFWQSGANLVLTARDSAALDSVSRQLEHSPRPGQSVRTVACDAASDNFAETVVKTAIGDFGRIDTLVCNAGIQGPVGEFLKNDLREWEQTIAIDLISQVRLVHMAIPSMLKHGGSIIVTSGGGATSPRPRFSAYAAAKAALVRFAETLAHELADSGITVNCIAPGAMPTEMLREVVSRGAATAGDREVQIAQQTLAGGSDVILKAAELAVFLASERARGITGRLISAVWDRWEDWPQHLDELAASDLYTLRRITGRDRGKSWGDK